MGAMAKAEKLHRQAPVDHRWWLQIAPARKNVGPDRQMPRRISSLGTTCSAMRVRV